MVRAAYDGVNTEKYKLTSSMREMVVDEALLGVCLQRQQVPVVRRTFALCLIPRHSFTYELVTRRRT